MQQPIISDKITIILDIKNWDCTLIPVKRVKMADICSNIGKVSMTLRVDFSTPVYIQKEAGNLFN